MKHVTFAIPDTRTCFQCGARVGHCDHSEAYPYERVIRTHDESMSKVGFKWTEREERILEQRWRGGATSTELANLLNRSRSAITGKLFAMGLAGKQGVPSC